MSDTLTKTEAPVAIGDIFEDNWGYNQTNIDYYEVVGVSKTGRAKLHRIHKTYLGDRYGEPCVTVTPSPGAFDERREPTGYKVVTESSMDGRLWGNMGYNSAAVRVATAEFIASRPSDEYPTAWETRAGWGH